MQAVYRDRRSDSGSRHNSSQRERQRANEDTQLANSPAGGTAVSSRRGPFVFERFLGRTFLRQNCWLVDIVIAGVAAQLLQTRCELRAEGRIARIAIEIVHLVRVALQIVDLELLGRREVVNVFVALGSDSAARAHFLIARIFVVFIQPVSAPAAMRLAQQWHEAVTLIV